MRFGIRSLGLLLVCGTALGFAWLAVLCFSTPLEVFDGVEELFPAHAWSYGMASARIGAWTGANLVPALRAPFTADDDDA